MGSIFQGDPKFYLGPDGSYLAFRGGQPVMERGKANVALISLFTRRGWCGNTLARSEEEKIGSDFEASVDQPITLRSLNEIRDAAEKAMASAGFSNVTAVVTNPVSTQIKVKISATDKIGTVFAFTVLQLKNGSFALLDESGFSITDESGETIFIDL